MEIGENAEKSISHCTSVPVFPSDEDHRDDESESKRTAKNRRVSFASSTQLAQYLEPINPFLRLSKFSLPFSLSLLLSYTHNNSYMQAITSEQSVP